jgi:ubiquinone/menaquinone biosynthesis C-methylase UbiE
LNLIHRWYCNSDGWAESLQKYVLPWSIGEEDLGDNLLEIGPGPGASTDWLKSKVPAMTAIEIDHKLAEKLRQRMAGSNVTVVEGDATKLEFANESFSSAVCFTMLHHVPTAEKQNQVLAEAFRVLKPGGVFLGSDSTTSTRFKLFHVFDTCVPIHPPEFEVRLRDAGFTEAEVEWNQQYNSFRFLARKP